MNRDDLVRELWAAAERRADVRGVRLGQGADADIHRFAHTGADRILAAHPHVTAHDKVIEDATAAFAKLIDEMVSAASEIAGYRDAYPDTIGEQTLAKALSRLCPLFPIC